jgi:hypothetical protein
MKIYDTFVKGSFPFFELFWRTYSRIQSFYKRGKKPHDFVVEKSWSHAYNFEIFFFFFFYIIKKTLRFFASFSMDINSIDQILRFLVLLLSLFIFFCYFFKLFGTLRLYALEHASIRQKRLLRFNFVNYVRFGISLFSNNLIIATPLHV